MTSKELRFGPYRLDGANQRLHRGDDDIPLSPKGFSVLHYLAARPGKLVTKQELLEAVWPATHVTNGVLKRAVLEIRKALRDPVDEPQFIQTLHRRGYRFLSDADLEKASGEPVRQPGIVGRTREFLEFDILYNAALRGGRQIVFVSGEAGVGKTTLVTTWLGGRPEGEFALATGRCVQQFGAGEPYLPVFEALEQLSRTIGSQLIDLLRSRAPTWLLQMPSLISPEERARLREEAFGSTRERMLREITDALEALTQDTPLILALEDLHWSDPSTIDLIRSLAARTAPARLMVLATFRPGDAARSAPALLAVQNELEIHHKSKSIALGHLKESDVDQYVKTRFGDRAGLESLSAPLYRRTNGNPLFITCLVDELERSGNVAVDEAVIRDLVPETLQQMFERQADQLSEPGRAMLELGAAAGERFTTAHIADALGTDRAEIEVTSENLARRQLMLKRWTLTRLPDGSDSPGYAFVHALCRDALYRRIPPVRRAQLHGLLGKSLEQLYAGDRKRAAAELAGHFEMAGDIPAAIQYLREASTGAAERYANREAMQYLDRALDLIDRLRETDRSEARMNVLEQRAALRMSASDMAGSAADHRIVADEAAKTGDLDRSEHALLHTIPTLIFVDYRLTLKTIDEIRQSHRRPLPDGSARKPNPQLDHLIDFVRSSCWMYLAGMTPELNEEFLRATRALMGNEGGQRGRIGWMVSLGYQYVADYATSAQWAEDTRRYSLEDNNFFDYFIGTLCLIWSTVHRGNLGYALQLARDGEALATRNESYFALGWLQNRRAWVQMEAFDFESARPVCERIAANPMFSNTLRGSPVSLWLGRSRLGMGEYAAAWDAFQQLQSAADDRGIGFQYTLPLRQFQAECAIAMGNRPLARQIAERLVELAGKHGERTYASRGHRVLAEMDVDEGNSDAAFAHVAASLASLDKMEALTPLWQAHATAARVHARFDRPTESTVHKELSLKAAHRIADTLAQEPDLAASLLNHVNRTLAGTQT